MMKNTVYESPGGLRHVDWQTRLAPSPVVAVTRRPRAHSLSSTPVSLPLLQDACVERYHNLQPLHALAFAMGTYSRLSSATVTAGSSRGRQQQQEIHLAARQYASCF